MLRGRNAPISFRATQHSRPYPFLTDDHTTRQQDARSQYQHCQPTGEKINREIQAVNTFESAAEFVRLSHPDDDNLLSHLSDRSVLSKKPDRRTSADTAADCRACSDDYNWMNKSVTGSDCREIASTSDDSQPLNLSLRRTVSDTMPRGGERVYCPKFEDQASHAWSYHGAALHNSTQAEAALLNTRGVSFMPLQCDV